MAKNAGITDRVELLKINYGFTVFKNEFIKFAIYFLVFALLGKLHVYLYAFALLVPMRSFSGGFHLKSVISCALFSFGIFVLTILALPELPIPTWSYLVIFGLSTGIIMLLSPIDNEKKPIKTKERYQDIKTKAIVVAAVVDIIVAIMFFTGNTNLFHVGVWILAVQAAQLLIAWAMKRKK